MPKEPVEFPTCLESVFANPVTGFVVTRGGRVVRCNDRFAGMLGRKNAGELAGGDLAAIAAPGDSRDLLEALLGAAGGPDSRAGELFFQKTDGTLAACRCCCSQLESPADGASPAVLLLAQDITDYYAAVNEYKKALIDLEEAKLVQEENANALSDMIVQLELAEKDKLEKEKMQGVLELAVAAAHELSQPLQALQNDIFFLLGTAAEGGEEQQALESMEAAVGAMEGIISKIRKITTYKTTTYTKGITMLDIDGSIQPEDQGKTD